MQFEAFLLESFQNDIFKRELRLSDEELTIVKKVYPKAKITKLSFEDPAVDKVWYEVDIAVG